MRRKYITYILLLVFLWFLIIIKLNSILYSDSNHPSYRSQHPKILSIGYFKRYYRLSINEEPSNLHGEYGKAVKIPEDETEEKNRRFNLHKFNELASIKMPILRKLPEKRRQSCFNRKYPLELPTASIIIIFHNEAFTTLIRTAHTAISRSPYHLVKEVILVDDFSDYDQFPDLSTPLNEHFKNLMKVKILRAPKRVGLTMARLMGANIATGEVLVFLDSHCEAFDGWLEPLLLGIKNNPNFAITPTIETINLDDFSVNSNEINGISVGTFNWKADFTWHYSKDQDLSADTLRSPAMAGGLFAIRKNFFFESGSYDDKMTYWGGENIEMSFRLWMCGGGILQDKCSVVGHIFRRSSPHKLDSDSVLYNKLRGIEVWMDDYKNIVYERIGVKKYIPAAGSLESRQKLRKDLKCHSFEWYLKNVATHIRVPGPTTTIRNPHKNKCLDVVNNKDSGKPVLTFTCHNHGGNQKAFEVLRIGTIIYDELCLDLSKDVPGSEPTFYNCHSMGGNQQWIFLEGDLISHSVTKLCLKIDPKSKNLSTGTCNSTDPLQKFIFNYSD